MIYTITGLFEQTIEEGHYFGPNQEGLSWVSEDRRKGIFGFNGLIFPDAEHPDSNHFTGEMDDIFGVSTILNVKITSTHLSFTKHYNNRPAPILYEFKKLSDGTWSGYYLGEMGTFTSRCVFEEIPDSFLRFMGWENHTSADLLRDLMGGSISS